VHTTMSDRTAPYATTLTRFRRRAERRLAFRLHTCATLVGSLYIAYVVIADARHCRQQYTIGGR
jgi:hypothetical protein